MQCECDACQPQCSSLCPTCLRPGELPPTPHRQVQCYQVVDIPTAAGWTQGLQPVPPEECQNDAPAYMADTGQQLRNFVRDPGFFNGPEQNATCPVVPTCTKPVWGVSEWSTEIPPIPPIVPPWSNEEKDSFRSQFCDPNSFGGVCDCMINYLQFRITFAEFMSQLSVPSSKPANITDEYAKFYSCYIGALYTCMAT